MKSNILINCLVLFYNVGIFPLALLTFFILMDLQAYFEVFATEPQMIHSIPFAVYRSSSLHK